VTVVRRSGIALALLAAAGLAVGCGGKKKDQAGGAALKGTIEIGVLAPVELKGPVGDRGRDLKTGAQMAADEINAKGGVLGHKLQLDIADDACDTQVAYEAAKGYVTDDAVAGVIGGVCDDAAVREVSVLDGSNIPFLVTSAQSDDLTADPLTSTFLMNGTLYQQSLSASFWMNYRQATRLAVFQDSSAASKSIAKQTIGLLDTTPKVVGLQTIAPDDPHLATAVKAALTAKPNFVLWTGGAKAGGQLAKALKDAGFAGSFSATTQSDSQDFIAAGAPDGAFVTATSTPANTPTAKAWAQRFESIYHHAPGFDAMQGYDSLRTLAHAMQQEKSAAAAKVIKGLQQLDVNLTNALGVIRFAHDHSLLYDNRVILEVKDGKLAWNRSMRTDSLQ
jgi:branched-chain amino acid transport system substrate-binding protein